MSSRPMLRLGAIKSVPRDASRGGDGLIELKKTTKGATLRAATAGRPRPKRPKAPKTALVADSEESGDEDFESPRAGRRSSEQEAAREARDITSRAAKVASVFGVWAPPEVGEGDGSLSDELQRPLPGTRRGEAKCGTKGGTPPRKSSPPPPPPPPPPGAVVTPTRKQPLRAARSRGSQAEEDSESEAEVEGKVQPTACWHTPPRHRIPRKGKVGTMLPWPCGNKRVADADWDNGRSPRAKRGRAVAEEKESPGKKEGSASQGGASKSQSQSGSQLILNFSSVKAIARKRGQVAHDHARQALERVKQERLSEEEMARIRQEFCVHYPPPPSNMAAAGRYELENKREMTTEMRDALWETELKPWSDRWWMLYGMFTDLVRAKKMEKPVTHSTEVTRKECKRWAKAFREEHGDARPQSSRGREASDKAMADLERATSTKLAAREGRVTEVVEEEGTLSPFRAPPLATDGGDGVGNDGGSQVSRSSCDSSSSDESGGASIFASDPDSDIDFYPAGHHAAATSSRSADKWSAGPGADRQHDDETAREMFGGGAGVPHVDTGASHAILVSGTQETVACVDEDDSNDP